MTMHAEDGSTVWKKDNYYIKVTAVLPKTNKTTIVVKHPMEKKKYNKIWHVESIAYGLTLQYYGDLITMVN